MEFISFLSQAIVPLMVAYIVGVGLWTKCNLFDEFTTGAWDGLKTVAKLTPTLVGMLVAVGVMRNSGLLDFICECISKVTGYVGFPSELIPVSIVKMLSASAANGLLFDVFKEHGTDSFLGIAASIMMSCTETLVYCMGVYYSVTKVTKTRWTFAGGVVASVAGIAASVFIAGIMT